MATIHESIRRPVEFIGFVGAAPFSEVEERSGPAVQPGYVEDLARAHEEADFDRVLIGYFTESPDGWQVAAHVTQHTERLGVLIAHRPGFVAPTLAARYATTLDHFSRGRVALHIITGGSDADQARDGDFLEKTDRYARTEEYMEILRRCWTEAEPFDHEGRFYRANNVHHAVRPYSDRGIPLYFGGSSDVALDIAVRRADVYAMFGEPVADVRERFDDLKRRSDTRDRELGFSVSLRPILGATEEEAWERAHGFLETIRARKQDGEASHRYVRGDAASERSRAEGARRLLAVADKGAVADERLWTEIARETGAPGNSTAPVGTPEQVAETILGYIDAGATTILIRGFEPHDDAVHYGRDLIPLVRQEMDRRGNGRTRPDGAKRAEANA